MGTRFSMVLPGADSMAGEALAEFADAHLRSQEQLMSRFDPLSPISELNQRADEEAVAVVPAQDWIGPLSPTARLVGRAPLRAAARKNHNLWLAPTLDRFLVED